MRSGSSYAEFFPIPRKSSHSEGAVLKAANVRHGRIVSQGRTPSFRFGPILVTALIGALPHAAHAQAPALLWSTNIGAKLFAVDGQTNVYATSRGKVIQLTGSGVPVQTNVICPLGGIAQRDTAGNYYFSDYHDPGTDLGGGTLTNNTPFFIAKYTSTGTLVWATGFGFFDRAGYDNGRYSLTDLRLDGAGNIYERAT